MAYRKKWRANYRKSWNRGRKKFGKVFTTRKGRRGRYVYSRGRRVGFKAFRNKRRY